jgi:monoamine oxidase
MGTSYRRTADVVVVGAGISGLVAASTLVRGGTSVVVLEARDRVGGRMVRQSVIEGGWIDLGGQWIGPTQRAITALSDELGVQHFPQYQTGDTVLLFQGKRGVFTKTKDFPQTVEEPTVAGTNGQPPPISRADVAEALGLAEVLEALAQTVRVDAPWETPNAVGLDNETLGQWLMRNTSNSYAQFSVDWNSSFNESGGSPDQVSLLHSLFEQKANPAAEAPDTDLYHGAAGQIPPLVAASLGDAVLLGERVVAIEQNGSGATVSTQSNHYRCRAVVVAMPPMLTGGISYSPPLPAERLQLIQRMPMGTIAKVACIYHDAWWRAQGLSGTAQGDLPTVRATADSSPPSGRPGILTSFVQGDRYVSWSHLPESQRKQAVIVDCANYFGPDALNPAQYVETNWPADPLTQGAYNAYMPPGGWTSYGPALRAPVGRIHWAGTETATRWFGYFDGAVSAGQTAAAAILGRKPPTH